jgi:hypothetical protein
LRPIGVTIACGALRALRHASPRRLADAPVPVPAHADVGMPTGGSTMDAPLPHRPVTLVWIDAREALIVRWVDDAARIERIESDVPDHRRSTGHVAHDPMIRPGGGGGSAATAGEPRRNQHMRGYLAKVVQRLPEGDLVLTGPGTTHEHLAQVVRAADPIGMRRIETVTSARRTERQLVARLRELVGRAPRRRGGPGPTGRKTLVRRSANAAR